MYYICILCTHFLVANKIFLHRFLFYAVYMLRYFCVPIFLQRSHSFYFSTQLNTVLSLYCLVSFLNLMEHVLNTIPLCYCFTSSYCFFILYSFLSRIKFIIKEIYKIYTKKNREEKLMERNETWNIYQVKQI